MTESLRLRRTNFPEDLVGTCAYWFEVDEEPFGVSMALYDHGPQWEVFHAGTFATVRDDFDRLSDLRREAVGDCKEFLADLRREEEMAHAHD